ncbi:MAG: cysteine desulfurase [Spirochaetales bacterium]|nr:cysteine desulfurase [Spirochaetales bacterium]
MTYLDWAATAPPDSNIIQDMALAAVKYFGNPSSSYPAGKLARKALENAREQCATILSCKPQQLAFTSGGSESNAIAFLSRLSLREPGTLIFGGAEHPSVSEAAKILEQGGWKLLPLPPEKDGRISPDKLKAALERQHNVRMVSIMGVNNETGAIQPIKELVEMVRSHEKNHPGPPILFHADLVQAVGKITVNLQELGVDTAAFSAHKFRGPRGIGLFYHRNPQFEGLVKGGGQEHGVRPGTENVAGAMALASALEQYGMPHSQIQKNGNWLLEQLLQIPQLQMVPQTRDLESDGHYVPGILAFSIPPIPGEVLARVLADQGFALSTGSACSSNRKGKLPRSLMAMQVPHDVAAGMIRVSLGPTTERHELEAFLTALESAVKALSRVAQGQRR